METSQIRRIARERRRRRIRRQIVGTDVVPRVSVFRSNKHMYVQLISDESGRTLATVTSLKGASAGVTVDKAKQLGAELAGKCKALGIERLVFDRGGYRFHGRVKAVADAVREAGLAL